MIQSDPSYLSIDRPPTNAQALHTRNLKAGLDVSDPQLDAAWRRLVAGDGGDDAAGGTAGSQGVGWVLFGCVRASATVSILLVGLLRRAAF
jgi:hypothetical protein